MLLGLTTALAQQEPNILVIFGDNVGIMKFKRIPPWNDGWFHAESRPHRWGQDRLKFGLEPAKPVVQAGPSTAASNILAR